MAFLSKKQVIEIVQNRPEGASPEGVVAALRAKGHRLEGFSKFQGGETFTDKAKDIGGKMIDNVKKGFKMQTDVGKGAIKEFGRFFRGMSSFGERYLLDPVEKVVTGKSKEELGGPTAAEKAFPDKLFKTESTAEKVGATAASIAIFLAPSGKLSKIQKGATLAQRMAIEATTAGALIGMRQGKIDKSAGVGAIVAGLFPAAGAGINYAKRGFVKKVGHKIQTTVIKPSLRDVKDGFKVQNITKHKVGGSLVDTVTKTHTKMNALVKQLDDKLAGSSNKVNLNEVYDDTVKELLKKGKDKNFGNVGAINRVSKQLKGEIAEQVGDDGLTSLVKATNIKRGAGTKGAWSFGSPEPDASAVEKVYTTFYSKLKVAIEKNSPKGVREINKSISELIPISNAALKRLPIEQRNSVIGLTDSIGLYSAIFDPSALALIGATKLAKSGKFGQFLVNVGSKIGSNNPILQRVFGAVK